MPKRIKARSCSSACRGVPSVDDTSNALVEYKVTDASFGNRIHKIGSDFVFDLWVSDAPSYVADGSRGFEGFGSGVLNSALTADSIIRMSDGTSFYLEGSKVLKNRAAIGGGLTVQSAQLDTDTGQVTLTMSDTVSGVVDDDAITIAGREAKVVSFNTDALIIEFTGTATPVAQGSAILRLSDGSSMNLKGAAVLAAGLTVQGLAFDAGSGQAVLEISGDIPDAIQTGTGVRIAGLDAVVTDLDRAANRLTVTFIGELRPVAQGSGIRIDLPLNAGVTQGTSFTTPDFDVSDARLVHDSDTIRLTLVQTGNALGTAAQISDNNTALRGLRLGQILTATSGGTTMHMRVLKVDVASGQVDVLWLKDDAVTHDVAYSGEAPELSVMLDGVDTSVGVAQVTVSEKGVTYLLASNVAADKLDEIADQAAVDDRLTLNGVLVDAEDIVFSVSKRTLLVKSAANPIAAGNAYAVTGTPPSLAAGTALQGATLEQTPLSFALRAVAPPVEGTAGRVMASDFAEGEVLRQNGVDLSVSGVSAAGEITLNDAIPDIDMPVFDVKSGRFIQMQAVDGKTNVYRATNLASHAVGVTGTVTADDFDAGDVLFQDGVEVSVTSVDETNGQITLDGALANDAAPVLVGKSGRFVILKLVDAENHVYSPIAATYIPVSSATGVAPRLSTVFSGAAVFANLPLEISGGIGGIDVPTLPPLSLGFDFALPSLNFGIGGLLPGLPGLTLPSLSGITLPSLPDFPSLSAPSLPSLPPLPDLPGLGSFPSLPDFNFELPDLNFTKLFGNLDIGSSLSALIELIETVTDDVISPEGISNRILTAQLPLLNFSIDEELGIIPVFRVINSAVTGLDDNLLELQTILDREFAKLGFEPGDLKDPNAKRVTVKRVDFDDPDGDGERNDLVFGIDIRKGADVAIDQSIDIASLVGEINGIDPALADTLDKLFDLEGTFAGKLSVGATLKLNLGLDLSDVRAPRAFIGEDSGLDFDLGIETDHAEMTAAFDVGGVGVSVSTSSDAGLKLEMVEKDREPTEQDTRKSFLGLTFGNNGNEGERKLYLSNDSVESDIKPAVTSDKRLNVIVPIVGTVDAGETLGSFDAKIVDFNISLDPSVLIEKNGSIDPANDLFIASYLGRPSVIAEIDVERTETAGSESVNIEIEPVDPLVANTFTLVGVSSEKIAVDKVLKQGSKRYKVTSIDNGVITVVPQDDAPDLQTQPVTFGQLRGDALLALGYKFAKDFGFDAALLQTLANIANQELSFSTLFQRLKDLVDGIDTALTGFDVPFVGETLAELMGIDDDLGDTLDDIKGILDGLIADTTGDAKQASAATLVEMFYERLLKRPVGTTSHDGVTFDPRFVFGKDSTGTTVAKELVVDLEISIFELLRLYDVKIPTSFTRTLRPSDYLPRNELNALRALGVDIDLEMDPITLEFGFDAGLTGSFGLLIGGTIASPDIDTTLKQGSGVYVGMSTRAHVDEATLSAGLTFVPGGRISAGIQSASFAIDGDGAVERNGAGGFDDAFSDMARITYATTTDIGEDGHFQLAASSSGRAALILPVYFPVGAALTGSASVVDTDFLSDEEDRYATYVSDADDGFGELSDWISDDGAKFGRNAIFIGYDLNSDPGAGLDLIAKDRLYYYVPNPMPQLGLGMFIQDPLLLVDGLRGILDALDKTIRQAPLFKMDLPFIGDSLRRGASFVGSTLVDPVDDALGDLQNLIRSEKSKRDGEFTTVDLLQYALFDLFETIEDATGGRIDFVAADGSAIVTYDDVDVTLSENFDDLQIGIRAMGDIFDPIRVDLDVSAAVPGLPLSFGSDATIAMGMSYDMYLGFGVSFIDGELDFYIDTARENELVLEAYADLNDDASLRASLGFLDFNVSNMLKDGHKELSAALTVDLKDPNAGSKGRLDDGRLSLMKELRGVKFRDVVDAQFTARAQVSLALVGSFGGSTQFPRFLTDFHYSQVFADINLTTGGQAKRFWRNAQRGAGRYAAGSGFVHFGIRGSDPERGEEDHRAG